MRGLGVKCWGQKVRVQCAQTCMPYHDVGQGRVSGFIQSQVCSDNSRQVDTHQFQTPVHLSSDVELGALSLQFRGEGRLKRREEPPFVMGTSRGQLFKKGIFPFGSQAHMPSVVVACSIQSKHGSLGRRLKGGQLFI